MMLGAGGDKNDWYADITEIQFNQSINQPINQSINQSIY